MRTILTILLVTFNTTLVYAEPSSKSTVKLTNNNDGYALILTINGKNEKVWHRIKTETRVTSADPLLLSPSDIYKGSHLQHYDHKDGTIAVVLKLKLGAFRHEALEMLYPPLKKISYMDRYSLYTNAQDPEHIYFFRSFIKNKETNKWEIGVTIILNNCWDNHRCADLDNISILNKNEFQFNFNKSYTCKYATFVYKTKDTNLDDIKRLIEFRQYQRLYFLNPNGNKKVILKSNPENMLVYRLFKEQKQPVVIKNMIWWHEIDEFVTKRRNAKIIYEELRKEQLENAKKIGAKIISTTYTAIPTESIREFHKISLKKQWDTPLTKEQWIRVYSPTKNDIYNPRTEEQIKKRVARMVKEKRLIPCVFLEVEKQK